MSVIKIKTANKLSNRQVVRLEKYFGKIIDVLIIAPPSPVPKKPIKKTIPKTNKTISLKTPRNINTIIQKIIKNENDIEDDFDDYTSEIFGKIKDEKTKILDKEPKLRITSLAPRIRKALFLKPSEDDKIALLKISGSFQKVEGIEDVTKSKHRKNTKGGKKTKGTNSRDITQESEPADKRGKPLDVKVMIDNDVLEKSLYSDDETESD